MRLLKNPFVLSAALVGAASALTVGGIRTDKQGRPVAPPRTEPARRPTPPAPGLQVSKLRPVTVEKRLRAGEAILIHAGLPSAADLPANGRLVAEWTLVRPSNPTDVVASPNSGARAVDALGIYTPPTAGWQKVLHALDPDATTVYQAPVAGDYRLSVRVLEDGPPVGDGSRWREKGGAPELFPAPPRTPWPDGKSVSVSATVTSFDIGSDAETQRIGALIEAEPNDTPELAQTLSLQGDPKGVKTWEVTGSADDIEFFDNGKNGRSGDDWFRLDVKSDQRMLLTAQLSIPGQFLAARIRAYALKPGASPSVRLGDLLPVDEYAGTPNKERPLYTEGKVVDVAEGQDPNERAHQQEESHRINISRLVEGGRTYYLRVEANAPGYQLQIRLLPPAPYKDPRLAVRQGMYTHIGQVDAWLANRPRGASVDRRIRDTGNLLGTQCMSCHTQSGIWGPAVPLAMGYKLENTQNFWRLINVMYECLRPTNVLKDAANNTSLAPLDIGDGPAGTRAAGFNIINAESVIAPRKLHSKQQIRTANFVLQTSDPGGINAAGPGSNIGRAIVWLFSTEILRKAWDTTGEPRYFRALEERARNVLDLDPRYTDDVAVRLDYFGRVFPLNAYPEQAKKAAEAERASGKEPLGKPEEAADFVARVRARMADDVRRLREIQNEDGTWGFNPGTTSDGGQTWKRTDNSWDPSPTALSITGLTSAGVPREDPTIAKAVNALLARQDTNGRWNRAAITGFVPTAYALRALGRLYPEERRVTVRAEFVPRTGESPLAAVRRVQALALNADPSHVDLMISAARHPNLLVRMWAMIGLGAVHRPEGVSAVMAGIREPYKPVREAAVWALRQTLLDDHGWDAALTAAERGDDLSRASVMQALGMRADAVMPKAGVDWSRLTRLFDRGMNDDPHPAVRAWATKAAWQWWIWNPPVRAAVNDSWIRMMTRAESNALVENSNRYSSQALFIANGHKANGSKEHQYAELGTLFESLRKRLESADAETKRLLARRIVSVASTFFQTSGGDGGPGQLGYVTPGSGALVGQAVLVYLREAMPTGSVPAIRAGLEGAANVPHGPLQELLINYTLNAPEELRKEAAAAVSDPRSAMLQAATELVEPLIEQVRRGAREPARRATLSDPVLKLFGSVTWVIPKDEEQQRHFLDLMVPKLERYMAPGQIAALPDAAQREAAERDMDAEWYLADKLGEVMANNPDLRLEMTFQRYFPDRSDNTLRKHYWVRSIPWLLEHKAATAATPAAAPEPATPGKPQQQNVDPTLVLKDRALQIYLDALKPDANPRTRAAAIRVANATSVRQNPEVLRALADVLKTEKDEQLRKIAENVVKQGSERFVPDLIAALKAEGAAGAAALSSEGKVNQIFLQDLTYFRDYVVPELARVKRNDQFACQGCHGIQGRVPSFYIKPTDEYGYLAVADLLYNYRQLQAKVNMQDLEKSKILRKPLNIQDGKEDGHQGGRRYLPTDEGYLLLKQWVENQPKVQGIATRTTGTAAAAGKPAASD